MNIIEAFVHKYSTYLVQLLSKLKSMSNCYPDAEGLQPMNVAKNRRPSIIPGTLLSLTCICCAVNLRHLQKYSEKIKGPWSKDGEF